MSIFKIRSLLTPLLTAVEAPNELGHRLIRRARLHLVVRTLPLTTLGATEHIGSGGLVHFQHLCLTLDGHFHVVTPLLGVKFGKRHRGNIVWLEFTLLQAVNKTNIADVRSCVNIGDRPPSTNLIQCLKFRILPHTANRATLGVL